MSGGGRNLYFGYDGSGKPYAMWYRGTNYYYVTNLQGDVIGILDNAGNQIVTYTYAAWGYERARGGSMKDTLGVHNPLRYRGYAYDPETELYYLLSIAAITKAIEETQKHNDERGIYYVYVLSDGESVLYVGRTKDPKARETAHGNNPFRSHLDFKIIARNLSYNQARGLEQALMLYYHTINRNDKKNNQINGISPYNASCPIYMDAAENALGYIWNQFSNDVLNWLES